MINAYAGISVAAGPPRLRAQFARSFNRGDEFGGAFDELSGFLRTCRCSLVITFLASVLGAAGKGTEVLVELTRGNEYLAEQRPGAAVGLRKLASLPRERLELRRAFRNRRR